MRQVESSTPRRGRFYSGLFMLTFSTLMLEVIETRLLSDA
jgi:hypothetical protein